jgi:hypothetical protein
MSGAIRFPETRAKAAQRLLQPPREMREIAASPGIGQAARLQARGHRELQASARRRSSPALVDGA